MDEYHRLTLLASVKEELWDEAAEAHLSRRLTPPTLFGLRPRRVLLALTVVLLGMVTWWGH